MLGKSPQELTLDRVAQAFPSRYEIQRELGRGGMGAVFAAHDVKMGRAVAVKVLLPELGETVGVDRFMRETALAATLNHPHIVPVLDRGEASDLLYYVMPLVEGETLREILDRDGPLAIDDVQRYVRDVVDGLEFAHGLDVVHRDIKPENVMISGRHALLMDFGIAKAITTQANENEQLTTVGAQIGTASYMSPEQVAGESLDQRSDIYAVGVLAYELLTGTPPFSGAARQVMVSHLAEAPRPVTEMRARIPASMATVVMRCLEKEADDRYQQTGELLTAIEQIQASDRPARARPQLSRRGILLASGVTLGVAAAIGAFVVSQRPSAAPVEGPAPGRIVVIPFENFSTDDALDDAGRMAAEWITQGLHREELGEAVPASTVARMLAALPADEADPIGVLANALRAEILVSGSVFREQGEFVINAEVNSAITGQLVGSTEPVRASTITDGIATITQRVQGMLGAHFNFGKSVFQLTPPPSMAVYEELLAGREAFYRGSFAQAIVRLEQISALEPTYLSHIPLLASVLYWTGDYTRADSILTDALARADLLTSNERLSVEYMLAWVQGDVEEEYRTAAAREGADVSLVYNYANAALRSNRPQQALELFASADLESPFASLWAALWAIPPSAHHALGSYEEALDAARRARRVYPNELSVLNLELEALAALGSLAQFDELMETAKGLVSVYNAPPMDTPGWTMIQTSLELRAHGHVDAGARVAEEAVQWYEQALALNPSQAGLEFGRAIADYVRGDWTGAEQRFADLERQDPDNIDYIGFSGVLAARSGDLDRAALQDTRLANLGDGYLYGRQTRWRARIAALLGDSDRSLALLRSAFGEGISLGLGQDWSWLHIDPDLGAIRGLPEFQAWSAPTAGFVRAASAAGR